MRTNRPLVAFAMLAALVAAPTASAMYIVTPLKIQSSDDTPHVGDTITLTLLRDPEYNEEISLAGKTVLVKLNYDPKEGEENSEPGSATPVFLDLGTVTLDDKESATLTFTIPQELDDHNAFLTAVDENGEDVGTGYTPLAVGDAPPIMMVMRSTPADGEPVPEEGEPVPETVDEPTTTAGEEAQGNLDDSPPTDTQENEENDAQENATPGVGLLAFVAVAGLAALALRRRA